MATTGDVVLDLSFREKAAGGDVVRPSDSVLASILAKVQEGPGRGLVLLIHGYNNDLTAAREAYSGFLDVQRELAELRENEPMADNRAIVRVPDVVAPRQPLPSNARPPASP